MAKGFDLLHINDAVGGKNRFDLSRSHLTTAEFGQILPLMSSEMIPGDKFNVKASYFSRMAPLVLPTYGKAEFKTAAFFVPYHQVSYDIDAWLAGKTINRGIAPVNRYFLMVDLFNFFVSYHCSIDGTQESHDFSYINSAGTTVYKKLNTFGRMAYKVFRSLGYQIPQPDFQTGSEWVTSISSQKLSALPLLCYLKAYTDWMQISSRYNVSNLVNLLERIRNNSSITIGESTLYSNGRLYTDIFSSMLNDVRLAYDNDYFTSCWSTPNSLLDTIESVSSVSQVATKSISTSKASYRTINNGVDNVSFSLSSSDYISQRSLRFLKAFDNWVRRNNYSGAKDVNQIYSRFGIKIDNLKEYYAHLIGTDSSPIQIGDVTSMAQTQQGNLGEYAGKGIMSGEKGFSYSAQDFGQFIILGWYTVRPMYYQGFDRSVLKNTPMDYFQPEFDGLGGNPVSRNEVCVTYSGNKIFGFNERYNEYKFGRDLITGDYDLGQFKNSGIGAFHFGRDLSNLIENYGAQTTSFNNVGNFEGTTEYNKIFQNPDDTSFSADHFYLTCYFDVEAYRPMKTLSEAVDLGRGDTTIERNGNQLN
ncbi:major capsid protein [Capybara microvirus Cap1_SP_107]|nr:major capsid protein [Capybara microvirus Cap1_SP_107]